MKLREFVFQATLEELSFHKDTEEQDYDKYETFDFINAMFP
jgi:hypothetical protein